MKKVDLEQRIALWKAMPVNSRGETDIFIDALIARIEELGNEVDCLAEQL